MPPQLRQVAAAVASRVFFHLEEPTQALRLALQAGPEHFDVMERSPYEERLVSAALDAYYAERRRGDDAGAGGDQKGEVEGELPAVPVEQLRSMVYRILDNCCETGKWDLALSIALESREPDRLKQVLESSCKVGGKVGEDAARWIRYTLKASNDVVSDKSFRLRVWQVVADCLEKLEGQQYHLVLVYQLLNKPDKVAGVLKTLLEDSPAGATSVGDSQLLGLQICFDLMDSGDQAFAKKVAKAMFPGAAEEEEEAAAAAAAEAAAAPGGAAAAAAAAPPPLAAAFPGSSASASAAPARPAPQFPPDPLPPRRAAGARGASRRRGWG